MGKELTADDLRACFHISKLKFVLQRISQCNSLLKEALEGSPIEVRWVMPWYGGIYFLPLMLPAIDFSISASRRSLGLPDVILFFIRIYSAFSSCKDSNMSL
jgi:hypothetical protein